MRGRHGFAPAQEREAEMLASMIYARATSPRLPPPPTGDPFLDRFATMLGHHYRGGKGRW
ncbi:hypothetical protein GT354_49875 [Streptomyces sp. SID3343]|nr:hypothetical protein [Streptomyces sp. SID3343]MYW06257.1 hypothetical protein [Streptomyces sp. SID3343]